MRWFRAGGGLSVGGAMAEPLPEQTPRGADGTFYSFEVADEEKQAAEGERQDKSSQTEAPPAGGLAPLLEWLYPLGEASASPAAARPRFEALSATRWVASVQIVAMHFYGQELQLDDRLLYGGHWVQYFFMLSGFLLSYSEMTRPPGAGPEPVLRYLQKRLKTVYPSYLLALAINLLTWPPSEVTEFGWSMLPMHILLMQAWLPLCSFNLWSCTAWGWIGECWFLSALVLFWFLLRPVSALVRRMSLVCSCTLFVGLTAWSYFFHAFRQGKQEYSYLVSDMLCRATAPGYLHVFVGGIVCMRILILISMVDAETHGPVTPNTRRIVWNPRKVPVVFKYGCCLGYLAYFLFVMSVPFGNGPGETDTRGYYFFHGGGLMPVMGLVLMGASIGEDPLAKWVFKSQPFIILGRISYMQYLFQRIVWQFANRHIEDKNVVRWAYPLLLLAFSYAVQRWFEAPLTELQSGRLKLGEAGMLDGCSGWLSRAGFHAALGIVVLGAFLWPICVIELADNPDSY